MHRYSFPPIERLGPKLARWRLLKECGEQHSRHGACTPQNAPQFASPGSAPIVRRADRLVKTFGIQNSDGGSGAKSILHAQSAQFPWGCNFQRSAACDCVSAWRLKDSCRGTTGSFFGPYDCFAVVLRGSNPASLLFYPITGKPVLPLVSNSTDSNSESRDSFVCAMILARFTCKYPTYRRLITVIDMIPILPVPQHQSQGLCLFGWMLRLHDELAPINAPDMLLNKPRLQY